LDNEENLKELAQYLAGLPEEEFEKLLKEACAKQDRPLKEGRDYNRIARLLGRMMDLCESGMEILDGSEENKEEKLRWKVHDMASCLEEIVHELDSLPSISSYRENEKANNK